MAPLHQHRRAALQDALEAGWNPKFSRRPDSTQIYNTL
jgi:hypothetical protein